MVDLNGEWKIHEGWENAWQNPRFDDSQWELFTIPGLYYQNGFTDHNCYLRKRFVLKEAMQGEDLFFISGMIFSGIAEVYINGISLGTYGTFKETKHVNIEI